jgi:hypothetical protein
MAMSQRKAEVKPSSVIFIVLGGAIAVSVFLRAIGLAFLLLIFLVFLAVTKIISDSMRPPPRRPPDSVK